MSLIFAHRGFCHKYPENTMLAFRKAVEMGCRAIELDVQFSSDGEVVIIHDESLTRTTGVNAMVREKTLSELHSINACAEFAGMYDFQPIPTLREYFEYIKDKDVLTNIEIKSATYPYQGLEDKTIALINEYGLAERIWLSSFNHFTIERCRKLAPGIKGGLIISCWMKGAAEYACRMGADTLNARYAFLSKEVIDELHSFGVGAVAWTPNSPDEIEKLIRAGADAIVTNRPDLAMEIAGKMVHV